MSTETKPLSAKKLIGKAPIASVPHEKDSRLLEDSAYLRERLRDIYVLQRKFDRLEEKMKRATARLKDAALTIRAVNRVLEDKRVPDPTYGEDWVLASDLMEALAPVSDEPNE